MSRPARGRGRSSERGRKGDVWIRHIVSEAEAGRPLQEVLIRSVGISRRMLQRLTRTGGLLVNGRASYLKGPVRAGDVVAVRIAGEEDPGLSPVPMELAIAFEDEHLLVVDKPAGLLVHPVRVQSEPTLAHGIIHHLLSGGVRRRVRPVHRLDRGTSGLLLVAKHAFAHQALDRQLRKRRLRREYLALVHGATLPSEGEIDAPIGPHPEDPNLRAVAVKGGDPALTRFRVLERYTDAALLRLQLETGRTHQIRVHLSHLGHPVIGDARYGGRRLPSGRQALHAAYLSFRHPISGNSIELHAPLPRELEDLKRQLREGSAEAESQG
ncbi:MAG TPA: RluA family pseudouridine synthase [Longimicrobiaceae bacterium]